jgi:hypothetical protein
MNRSMWFWVCVVIGLVLLAAGLLVPIHLRAVDAGVLSKAGRRTPALVEAGLVLAAGQELGAAQLLLQAAQAEKLPDANRLEIAVDKLAREHPDWVAWGGGDSYLAGTLKTGASPTNSATVPFTEIVIRTQSRAEGLRLLRASACAAAQEILRCRSLTNTVIFPPSASASGQVIDAAIVTCGLLLTDLHLTTSLSNMVYRMAAEANRGGPTAPLEQVFMDLMSLGQRLNWSQLTMFVRTIDDVETLHLLANDVRKTNGQLPVLYSVVLLSSNPAGTAHYLEDFSQTGMKDLGTSLQFGQGGIQELLRRNQQLHVSTAQQSYASGGPIGAFYNFEVNCSLRSPRLALAMKWLFYLAGGLFAAGALHFAKPPVSFLEEPLQVRGLLFIRELLFALGFLLTMLMLSEPFLAQDNQKAPPPLRLRLPLSGVTLAAEKTAVKTQIMNQSNLSLMTLAVFFVLQGLLYLSCLLKLAEIRRQRIRPAMKLKLLENEEHLFDAGLYLGFAGTIVSLIFVSLGVIHFSLMAAYSSTSFGIIFVSIFKIFHLRPFRRTLLMEADAATREPAAHASAAAPVSTAQP